MTRLVAAHPDNPDLLVPRDGVVREGEPIVTDEGHVFDMVEGPVRSYRRTVRRDGDTMVETIDYEPAIPYWNLLLRLPLKWAIRSLPTDGTVPKWAPPQRMSRRSAEVLATLAVVVILGGFLSNTQGELLTYAASEFDVGNTAQGVGSAVSRIGTVLAIGAAAIADRRGRRLMLAIAMFAGILGAATVSLAPTFPAVIALMTLVRTANSAMGAAVFLIAMEEMPAGNRAYSLGLLAMPAGLGAGMVVWVQPVADLGPRAWRIAFLVPLLLLPFVVGLLRRLPESRRFGHRDTSAKLAPFWRKIVALGLIYACMSMFLSPIDQFRNEYLRSEHGFSAGQVSLLILLTVTPGSVTLLLSGKLADTIGRKIVITVNVLIGLGSIVWFFNAAGPYLWISSVAAVFFSAGLLGALGVYRGEMFPTNIRGRASSIVGIMSVIGGSTGLLVTGYFSDRWGSFAPVITRLWFVPMIGLALAWLLLREESGTDLDELHPSDAAQRPAQPS